MYITTGDIQDWQCGYHYGDEASALDIATAAARQYIDAELPTETVEDYLSELKGPRNARYIAVRHALVVLANAYEEN